MTVRPPPRRGFFAATDYRTGRTALPLLANCADCGLDRGCLSPKMPVWGRGERKVMLIGEAPGKWEDQQNRPFVGDAGEVLQEYCRKLGVDMRRDCWVLNAARCRPARNKLPPKSVDYCRPNVVKDVKALQPEVIVLLGAVPVKSLISWLWKEDPGGIYRWAGWRIPCQRDGAGQPFNTWVVPAFHPSHLLHERKGTRRNEVLERLFEDQLRGAFGLRGRPWAEVPDYPAQVRRLHDVGQAAAALRGFVDRARPVAFDFETDATKPDVPGRQIVTCSVSDGEDTIAYPWDGPAVKWTRRLLASPIVKYGWNCFGGDTKFLTREYGVVTLREMVGRQVTVLNHERRWVGATVRSFGLQETEEVRFCRRNHKVKVRVTGDHQWVMADDFNTRLTTDELKAHRYSGGRCAADQVPYLCAPKVIESVSDYEQGVRHGIVLGDGWRSSRKSTSFMVRLCGGKDALGCYFDGHHRSYPSSYKGDMYVSLHKQSTNLKDVPSDSVSDSYLVGFFRGLLATDGCVNHKGQISITNSKKVVDWCLRVLPRVGYWFQGRHDWVTRYGEKHRTWARADYDGQTVYLSRESVSIDDVLLPSHRARYFEVNLGPYKFSERKKPAVEEVFCAVVPDGRSFTLDGGLVTGNCKYETRWWLARFGVMVNNFAFDGMLAAHVLDNRPTITSLKFQAFARLGAPPYDDMLKPYLKPKAGGGNDPNRVRDVGLDKLLMYNGIDSILTWHLCRLQLKQLGLPLE